MSYVAIGLFVLACGWNVYRLYLPTRASAIRNEGHPQYFGAALAAAYVAFLAIFLHAASSRVVRYSEAIATLTKLAPHIEDEGPSSGEISPQVQWVVGRLTVERSAAGVLTPPLVATKPPGSNSPQPYPIVLAVGLWSALLALLLPVLLNVPYRFSARLRLLAGRKSLNDIEETAVRALERGTSLLVTLATGKVYVGIPVEIDPNGAESDWISIWPLASGYRTRKGRLRLITAYEEAYRRLEKDLQAVVDAEAFKVTLPLAHIVTVQAFSLEFYVAHFLRREASDSEVEDGPPVGVPAPADSAPNGSDYPYRKVVPDVWLRLLKWAYHLLLTATVVALPFSILIACGCAILAFFAVDLSGDPADERLEMLLDAARDA